MSQIRNIATELLAWGDETANLYRKTNELIYTNLSGHLHLLSAYMYRLADEPSPSGGVSSFNTRVGDVVLLDSDVIDALGFVPLSGMPTLDQVTNAGNSTANSITVGTITGNSGISQFKFNTGAGAATPTLAVGNTSPSGKFAGLLAGTVGAEFNFDNAGWFAIAGDSKNNYTNNNLGSGSETYYLRVQGGTGNIQINTTTDAGYKLDVNGSIRGTSVAVVGGTAAQFLKANGTLDSTLYTPQSRNLTINGVTYDLSADRIWNVISQYTSRVQHQVKAGVAINKGQAVYVTSADGTNMIVSLASNAQESTSSKTMGLLDATVSINGFANVVTEGLLAGLDTTGANAAGDPVWLGTNGNLIYGLTNKPYAPAHLVFVGIVTRINANNGEIFVKVQNGFELDELHNVDARNPSNNDGIFYNTTTQLWEHKQISAVYATPTLAQVTTAGNTTTNAITVGGLTVNTTANAGGIILQQNGTNIGEFRRVGNNNRGALYLINSGTTEILLETGGFSYIRSNGFGIGTATDAGYKLDVNGTGIFRGNLEVNAGGNGGIFVNNVYPRLIFGKTGTPSWSMYADTENAGQFEIGSGGGYPYNTFSRYIYLGKSGQGGIGLFGIPNLNTKFLVSGSTNAQSNLAQGVYMSNTLVATANNDVLVGLDINPTFTNGAFTGITDVPLRITNNVKNINGGIGMMALQGGNGTGATAFPWVDIRNTDATNNKVQFTIGGGTPYGSQTRTHSFGTDVNGTGLNDFYIYKGSTNSAVFIIAATGNVIIGNSGISYSDAGYKLDVNGTTRVSSNLTVDTDTLYVDATNHRVGIGTTTPLAKLHISTNTGGTNTILRLSVAPSSANVIHFRDTDGTSQGSFLATGSIFSYGTYQVAQVNLAGGVGGIGIRTSNGANSHIRFYSGNADADFSPEIARFVASTGNLLINSTTDAGYKLDVNGTLRVQGTVTATLANVSTANVVYYNSSTGLMTYGAAPSGGTPTLATVTTSGNTTTNSISVGGLTVTNGAAPIATFNSSNEGGTYIGIQYNGALKAGWGMGGNIVGAANSVNDVGFWSTNDMYWETNTVNRMILTSGGNLLINTISDPGYKLHVNGTANISGNLTVGGTISTAATYTNCGLIANINVASNTTEIIGFTTKIDPNNWWNPGTKKWTPTIAGYYYVTLQVRWDIGTLGNQINIQILKNTNTVAIAQDLLPTSTGKTQTTNAIIQMNGTTDYLTFSGYSSSTTGEFIYGEPLGNWTFFNAFKLN